MKYCVYYKPCDSSVWSFHGVYSKTDALGTASLCLKIGYNVLIEIEKCN